MIAVSISASTSKRVSRSACRQGPASTRLTSAAPQASVMSSRKLIKCRAAFAMWPRQQCCTPLAMPLPPGGGELLTPGNLARRTLFDGVPVCLARCTDLAIGAIEEGVRSDTTRIELGCAGDFCRGPTKRPTSPSAGARLS